MKVILLQDVDNLGDKNEIKEVANGYARNFLIPRGMVAKADKTALKEMERRRHFDDRREKKLEEQLVKAAGKIRDSKIEIETKAGPEGKLYGSVGRKEIAAALSRKFEYPIIKQRVQLTETIKMIGDYVVPVKLKDDTIVKVTVSVISDAPIPEPEPKETAQAPEQEVQAAAQETVEEPAGDAAEPESDSQEAAEEETE
jgi:large subunit ribosomal protein L9